VTPRISVVVPAYDEGDEIGGYLDRLLPALPADAEVALVVDAPEDTTLPEAWLRAERDPRLRPLVSDYGRGPANAIRYGVDHTTGPVVVVTMADGSDDPSQVDALARLVEAGAAMAAASRYAPGGRQVGAPLLKRTLSETAGRSLHLLARVGTRDATNSFKAYDRGFLREVGIDSRHGFELGIELTAKATRLGRRVAEIPTVWTERSAGRSHFRVWAWAPHYLRWYLLAFGPRTDPDRLRAATAKARGG
jgi:glycosyltransferase involved in cell wall biosynthesis